jgi:nucleoside-diphosphate-sugar epimerase/SAM-dependent methyltransferase/quercetin dioxygenase-like cupin family protein
MKIVITGGLGYIGTELCKIYSGESRYKNITVIDSKFVSERVNQLRCWGINFIQASLFDEDIISKELSDADVIVHLAGITDVAYTKTESNSAKDLEITNVGVEGTRNVIKYSKPDAKIIFPSTHVVYEGFDKTMINIDESVTPCPMLTYARGKFQSEKDLINSDKNYIILRLASVYGYSTDTMRINIMPNLFSKIASQNGVIKLFSGGVQLKSLVPLIDVARCIKFMSENSISKDIFHVSKETMTVKDVAVLCKKINPNVKIIETKDEIPNLGYTISNKKLISTGFKFLYNIEDSLREMITKWSTQEVKEDLEYTYRGEKEYIDDRGKISNYELTEPINLIGYIESKTGSVRANHYHPIQEQKCLLVKGRYVSVIKDLSTENSVIETRLIKAGDMAVIKPNVAHTMVFLEDSVFLNLVRGEREHDNYGITHTIPYELVNEEFRLDLMSGFKQECRSCNNIHMKKVLSLGRVPLANNLLLNPNDGCKKYPLEIDYCDNCKNVQLNYVVNPKEMFDDYLYVSSTTESFRKHFENLSNSIFDTLSLNPNSFVVDIGSNDGVFLKPMKSKGVKVLGIEPAKNICKLANDNGIDTINSYFDEECANMISNLRKVDVVTAFNVFAHSDKLKEICLNAFKILKDDGYFVIEVQYLMNTIKDLTFDNIYHEHTNYWSVTSLNNFFKNLGISINRVEHVNTHGGSIRVYASKNTLIDDSVFKFLEKEEKFGINDYSTYLGFSKMVNELKSVVLSNISKLKEIYKISSYGSPAKATTALNFFGIDNKFIDYTVEDNTLKVGKFIPGVNIPIVSKEHCYNNLPDVIIVLAWNFYEEIKKNNQNLIDRGVKFISIKDLEDPKFKI